MYSFSRLLVVLALLVPATGCFDSLDTGLEPTNPDNGATTPDAPDTPDTPDAPDTPEPDPVPEPPPPPPPPPRIAEGLQALFLFDEGSGTNVVDHAPGSPNLSLTIPDPAAVTWLPGGGLSITQPTFISAQLAPGKVYSNCLATDEITIEAWVRPANLDQAGPARIMTYSLDTNTRNFTLGQDGLAYNTRLRTTETNDNGTPATVALETVSATNVQHVLFTRSALDATLWINGALAGSQELQGTFSNEWQQSYLLGIGNEVTLDRPWLGDIYLAAVYCRALEDAEIAQNYAAGY